MLYALIPVKDRYEYTEKCIESFLNQTYKEITIVVINDGSVDGTSEKIKAKFPNVIVLEGDGNLWCMGAFHMGVEYVLKNAQNTDYILTQNQDAYFGKDFVSNLISVSEKYNEAVVGSINYSSKKDSVIYHNHMLIGGVFKPNIIKEPYIPDVVDSDTLNTRGTIFPIKVIKKIGNFSKLFPHYAGDYEITCRAKKYGYQLKVSTKAVCYSWDDNQGLSKRISLKQKKSFKDIIDLFFSRRSASNIYYSSLLVITSVPFPIKIFGLARIFVTSLKVLLYDYFFKSIILKWKN
jgi:GT2 family glycosyltransferase